MPSNQILLPLQQHIDELPVQWQAILNQNQIKNKLKDINNNLVNLKNSGAVIFPTNPFRALNFVAPENIRAVIIGQDPYHTPKLAHGLAFSVPNHCKCPPSLRNIFKELTRQYPNELSSNTNDLTSWAMQGVLLINAVLTVEQGRAAAHSKLGWQSITDYLIQHIAQHKQPKVFMLWGAYAQQKQSLILQKSTKDNNLILKSNHPSPLSAMRPPTPFIGCGHFDLTNKWLEKHNIKPINWLVR